MEISESLLCHGSSKEKLLFIYSQNHYHLVCIEVCSICPVNDSHLRTLLNPVQRSALMSVLLLWFAQCSLGLMKLTDTPVNSKFPNALLTSPVLFTSEALFRAMAVAQTASKT